MSGSFGQRRSGSTGICRNLEDFRDSPRPARPVPGKRSRSSGALLDRGRVAGMFQPGLTSDILNRCTSIWRDVGESRRDPHRLGGPGAGLGEPRFAHRSGPICAFRQVCDAPGRPVFAGGRDGEGRVAPGSSRGGSRVERRCRRGRGFEVAYPPSLLNFPSMRPSEGV